MVEVTPGPAVPRVALQAARRRAGPFVLSVVVGLVTRDTLVIRDPRVLRRPVRLMAGRALHHGVRSQQIEPVRHRRVVEIPARPRGTGMALQTRDRGVRVAMLVDVVVPVTGVAVGPILGTIWCHHDNLCGVRASGCRSGDLGPTVTGCRDDSVGHRRYRDICGRPLESNARNRLPFGVQGADGQSRAESCVPQHDHRPFDGDAGDRGGLGLTRTGVASRWTGRIGIIAARERSKYHGWPQVSNSQH